MVSAPPERVAELRQRRSDPLYRTTAAPARLVVGSAREGGPRCATQTSMPSNHQPTGKRQRIDTTPGQPGGSRYIRRDAQGRFTTDQVDVGKSLASDRHHQAKHHAPEGQKDRGD